jgi:hypothetical protein
MPMFFSNFQWFYNFQSLYKFKSKFLPSQWRPAYVIHNFSKTDFRLLSVLTDAFVPQGPLSALRQMLQRKFDIRTYVDQMSQWVCDGFIIRAPMKRTSDLIFRAPISLLLVLIWIFLFGTVKNVGGDFSFSFGAMSHVDSLQAAWRVWGLPGFLHWNIWHLSLNLITFFIVGITLEIFCGTWVLVLAYGIGHLLANSATAGIIWTLGKAVPFELFHSTLLTEDVGASLGIWGCAGAWSYILKNRGWIWTAFPAVILFTTLVSGDFFQVNHVVAAALGFFTARFYFGKIQYEKI